MNFKYQDRSDVPSENEIGYYIGALMAFVFFGWAAIALVELFR